MHRSLQALAHLNKLPECWRCVATTKNYLGTILRYLKLSTTYPFEIQLRSSFTIEVKSFHDLVTYWVIFCRQEYPIPQDAQTIIDLGGNIGVFTLWAAMNSPKASILAVEPYPETFHRLTSQIKKNNLEESVATLQVGVAGSSGYGWMDACCEISQSIGLSQANDSTTQALQVKTLSLDELVSYACDKWSSKQIDLLKIDIEGSEHDAVHHSSIETLRKVRNLVLEYHPNHSKASLFSKFEQAGLQCVSDNEAYPNSGVAVFNRKSC